MERQEVEKCPSVDDASHLNRNRSFKTKQLVRSQAIRESASPPRTVSPSLRECERDGKPRERDNKVNVKVTGAERSPSESSQDGDGCGEERRQPVEIQITQGSWQSDAACPARSAAGRGARSPGDGPRDLLSYNPRVACVCGACAPCPHCRGRRRRYIGINKQDSGIGVDECADCETNGQYTSCGLMDPLRVVVDIRKASSLDSEEYCRCPERREKPRHTFTRTDSDEPTGPELVEFISETLNKNAKDRAALLKVEKELHALVNDAGRCIVKFPVMTSYGRMLVHRCAALFQLSHHPDQYNRYCVIVSKAGTSGGRIPCTSFKKWCATTFPPASPARAPDPAPPPHQAKSILKRACGGAAGRGGGALAARSKSLEQREQDYERARRRIFSQENSVVSCPQDNATSAESPWPWVSAGPVKLLTPEHARNKLLKVQSLEAASPPGSWRARGAAVAKSHSFGGYTEPPPTRALSRQGDLACSSWRLSPSSSGYKTLSLRSTDSVTPSPTGGGTPEPSAPGGGGGPAVPAPPSGGAVVWAVTDMARVPPGVTVIHPQTGRPLTNADGSLYRFDPDNPPLVYERAAAAPHHQLESSPDRRRGRLEKQHSFIDHEAESLQSEQCLYEYEGQGRGGSAEEKEIPATQFPPATLCAAAEPPLSTQTSPAPHLYQGTVYYSPQLYTQPQHYEEQVQSPCLSQFPSEPGAPAPPGKLAPLLDHNLSNMVVSSSVLHGAAASALPAAYHYVPHAPCRLEAVAPLYGATTPALDEQKVPSPPDNTFRIDASYPYPPLEYSSYVDPPAAPALGPQAPVGPLHQRSYSVGYGGELAPAAPYPVGGVYGVPWALPYGVPWALPYGAPLLGGPPVRPPHAPLLYPHHYNTLLYPQMVPQYPVCTPIFTTPAPRAPTPPSAERGGPTSSPPQGAPAYRSVRNNGHGILGRYPQHTSDVQLTGAARAIVNSIRQLQANNTYHNQDRRYEYRDRHDRTDRRADGRGDGQTDRHTYKHSYTYNDRHNYSDRNNYTQQASNQEKSHIQDRNGNAQDRNSNAQDRINYSDRNSNVLDKTQDRSNVQDRNSYQERSYGNYQQNQHGQDNSQTNRETNTKDIQEKTYDKTEIYPENTKEKLQVQSNTQESTNNVQNKSQSTQDRGITQEGGNAQEGTVGNAQDRTVGNAVDVSTAQERGSVQGRTQDAQARAGPERRGYADSRGSERGGSAPRGGGDRKYAPHAAPRPPLHHYRPHYLLRQMSPGTWCRRAPAPAPAPAPLLPGMPPPPRRPHPDGRSGRRY